MYILNPLPAQIPQDHLSLLEEVETATVGHVLHAGYVDRAIQAVLPAVRVAGTAVTVRIPGADSTLLHYILARVRPGDFLVIDRCGDLKHACWGGVVTNTARQAGVVGVVEQFEQAESLCDGVDHARVVFPGRTQFNKNKHVH